MTKRRFGAVARISILAAQLFTLGMLASLACATSAFAAPKDPPAASGSATADTTDTAEAVKSSLRVHAAPIFGSEVSLGSGWGEVVASIENVGGTTRRGTISLRSAVPWGNGPSVTTHAPFSVTPGRTAIVKLPTHGLAYQSPTYTIEVTSDSGVLVASITLPTGSTETPLLVDVDEPSRLAVSMRNWPLSLDWVPVGVMGSSGFVYGGSPVVGRTTTLSVGAPSFDRATGDPILPEHPGGYSSATVVLIHSDALARLDAAALQSLADWVIAGGSLAVVPSRADDLRGGSLSAFIGGAATTSPPSPVLLTLPTTPRPAGPGTLGKPPTDDSDDDSTPPIHYEVPQNAAPNPFLPISTAPADASSNPFLLARATTAGRGPSPAIRALLTGYSGGNLTPSIFGASAAYGMGEVHLLAFDPSVAPLVDDPWVQSRVVDLVTHAWDRRSMNAIQLGAGQSNTGDIDAIRRALDPNENFRPALAIAAILLILYSIVSGPVIFMQATKRGRPLAPLKWAPVASAVMFTTLVVVGLAGKGWRGRARHVALIEVGAGVSRGAIRRFRGFFTSDTRKLAIGATTSESVLSVTSSDSQDKSELSIDRGGMTIENVTSLPWQTIVAREDGVIDLKSGVSILTNPDGSIDVANHTGSELDDLLVYSPKDGLHYLGSLKDGARANSTSGVLLLPTSLRHISTVATMTVHSLDAANLGSSLDAKTHARLSETWLPVESAVGESVDWLPDDVPAVMAEIKGGEGVKHDSGLSVESDHLLLRVVGRGGAP